MSRDLEARSAIVARARPAFAITATLFTVIGLTLFSRDLSEESIRWAMRLSVDTAFPFFFLAFTAASVHKLKPSAISQYLLRNRRYLGISFAALFLLHGTLIYVLSQLYPEPFFSQLTDELLYGGLLTFVVVALMAITSNDFSVRLLGRKAWSRLHKVSGYFIAIMFLLTYLSKLDQLFFWPYAIAAVGVFGLRLGRWFVVRQGRAGQSEVVG